MNCKKFLIEHYPNGFTFEPMSLRLLEERIGNGKWNDEIIKELQEQAFERSDGVYFFPEQNGGCLVYHSKRNAKGRTMNIQGVCNHGNFGLQPGFIAKLIEHKDAFREKFGAGKPMTDSAIEWFREAGLMENNTTKITRLLTVAEKIGSDNPFLWQLIWLRLANYSPLVKWFVCFTRFGTTIDRVELDTILSNTILAKSSCDQAIKCLCNFFKNSPISSSLPLVHLIIKGKSVKSITRISIEPEPLTILYGLYLSASLTKRSSFTIREMQSAEFESPYVSPIAAFGIPPETFKTLVNGLAIRYPEFISVSFTHGLDEVRLFPDTKTIDNVLELINEE